MAEPFQFPQGVPVYVKDTLYTPAIVVNGGSGAWLENGDVSSAAAIVGSKLNHYYSQDYAQANTAAVDATIVIHVAKAAGTLLNFDAGSIAIAVGDATCTFDLKKNGTTVLSGVITLDSSNTNYVAEAATLSVTAYVSGDVFTVVVDGTIGTGTLPTGVFCQARFHEAAA
jgi:hypothetical protein